MPPNKGLVPETLALRSGTPQSQALALPNL